AYGHAPADPPARGASPRIGLVRTPWWDEADPYNRKNIEAAARALRAAGAKVREWRAPDAWTSLVPAQNRIMTKEATISYAKERARYSHLFSP
ncbi:amidase family protein, partial [Citrobacter freundii]|uniref:amidase family protein n=1 Tax=Citrobacter freundii TaxID=546 RepID=UPI001952FE3E